MRRISRHLPVVVTVAGSDSGGGAGIQADLKVFQAIGVHGTTVITCLTAQNPKGVRAVQATRPALVRHQWEALVAAWQPAAIKTGMLQSPAIVREVVRLLAPSPRPFIVVDPVMVATSGAPLLQPAAVRLLQKSLLPLATIATPNLDEAVILTGVRVRDPEDLRRAARVLHERYGCAALIKGGHLPGPEAIDVFWDGREELLLTSARIPGVSTHGTGCTYSAAIAAYLARGCRLPLAVERAKTYITSAIADSRRVGRHWVLGRGGGQGPEGGGQSGRWRPSTGSKSTRSVP